MANEISTQIVREAEPIERAKLELMRAAAGLEMPTLPAYEVAGMTPEQIQAVRYGVEGIGAYQPWLSSGASGVSYGLGTTSSARSRPCCSPQRLSPRCPPLQVKQARAAV